MLANDKHLLFRSWQSISYFFLKTPLSSICFFLVGANQTDCSEIPGWSHSSVFILIHLFNYRSKETGVTNISASEPSLVIPKFQNGCHPCCYIEINVFKINIWSASIQEFLSVLKCSQSACVHIQYSILTFKSKC